MQSGFYYEHEVGLSWEDFYIQVILDFVAKNRGVNIIIRESMVSSGRRCLGDGQQWCRWRGFGWFLWPNRVKFWGSLR